MLQQLHNLQPSRWSIVDMRCAEGYHQNDAVNRFADVNLSSVCMLCLVCLAWVVTWWTWQESCIKDRTKVTRRRFTIHYTKSIQLQYLYIHRLTSCLTCLFDDSIIYHLLYIDYSLCHLRRRWQCLRHCRPVIQVCAEWRRSITWRAKRVYLMWFKIICFFSDK